MPRAVSIAATGTGQIAQPRRAHDEPECLAPGGNGGAVIGRERFGMEAGQNVEHRSVPPGEPIPTLMEPRTPPEYRAAIQLLLGEIRRLFSEMDQNRALIEQKRADINLLSARSDANLRALEEQVESLRRT